MDGQPTQTFDYRYVAELLQELRRLSQAAGYRDLSYYLTMAHIEAAKLYMRDESGRA